MTTTQKVAVVTGANRGLGFEASRQLAKKGYQVVLTSRDEAKGKAAAQKLQAEDLDVIFHPLDVTNDESSQQLADFIRKQFGKLDVLVNNAAIYIDSQTGGNSVFDAKIDTLRQTMETNVYGVLRVTQALIGLMQKQNYGRIVNVSSGAGQLTDMGSGVPTYRISKTAMHRAAEPEEDSTQWANPADVTEVFIYLASDESRHVNGQRFQAQEENWGHETQTVAIAPSAALRAIALNQ